MKPVIIIAIAFVLLIPNIAFAQEPHPQQEGPNFIIMGGLIVVMVGNLTMLYVFMILTQRVLKDKSGLRWPYVHFILEQYRNDKKIRNLVKITIGLWVAGFAIQIVTSSMLG